VAAKDNILCFDYRPAEREEYTFGGCSLQLIDGWNLTALLAGKRRCGAVSRHFFCSKLGKIGQTAREILKASFFCCL